MTGTYRHEPVLDLPAEMIDNRPDAWGVCLQLHAKDTCPSGHRNRELPKLGIELVLVNTHGGLPLGLRRPLATQPLELRVEAVGPAKRHEHLEGFVQGLHRP